MPVLFCFSVLNVAQKKKKHACIFAAGTFIEGKQEEWGCSSLLAAYAHTSEDHGPLDRSTRSIK
jgi:hypothetical protein